MSTSAAAASADLESALEHDEVPPLNEGEYFASRGAERAAIPGSLSYKQDAYRDLVRMARVLADLNHPVPPETREQLISYFEWLSSKDSSTVQPLGRERRGIGLDSVRKKCVTVKSICRFIIQHWHTDFVRTLNTKQYPLEFFQKFYKVCINELLYGLWLMNSYRLLEGRRLMC